MNMKEFGKIIRCEREKQEMTLKILAEKSGFGFRTLQYWERGTMQISLENADKLLKALGIEIKIGGRK